MYYFKKKLIFAFFYKKIVAIKYGYCRIEIVYKRKIK